MSKTKGPAKKSAKTTDKAPPEKEKRSDFELIDHAISAAFAKILVNNKGLKVPSIESIAKEIGRDRKTVERHLKERSFEERYTVFRAGSDKVMTALFKKAIESDNPRFMEMWLTMFEGYGNKKTVDFNVASTTGATIKLPDGGEVSI